MRLVVIISMIISSIMFIGCGEFMVGETSIFNSLPNTKGKVLYTFKDDENKVNDLEYERYKKETIKYLKKFNYINSPNAKMYLTIEYGINNGIQDMKQVPITRMVKSGTTYSTQIIGNRTVSNTSYRRYYYLKIYKKDTNKCIYDGRVISVGTSSQLPRIMPGMLKIFFSDFPGKDGENRKNNASID
jgi:hypothetical protein